MTRALLIVAVLASHANADRCFSGPMSPAPYTRPGGRVAGSGGVIVLGDTMPDWRFRSINKRVRAQIEVLAPGLAIYHPPPLPGDEVELENEDHQLVLRATRAFSVEPPLDAPAVAKIVTRRGDRGAEVTATFVGTVPAKARIAFVSRVERDRLVPLSWGAVLGEPNGLVLWHSPYGCDETISGWIQPKAGNRVVVTWVDDAGRVSAPSSVIEVKAAK